jgi:hypothetical protein
VTAFDETSWWWPVVIVAFIIIVAQNLWRATATGTVEMRRWEVRRAENPAAFWFAVVAEVFFVTVAIALLGKWFLDWN